MYFLPSCLFGYLELVDGKLVLLVQALFCEEGLSSLSYTLKQVLRHCAENNTHDVQENL